jgi:hypothetical protein
MNGRLFGYSLRCDQGQIPTRRALACGTVYVRAARKRRLL